MGISKNTTIEDLVNCKPDSIALLHRYGLRAVICGEPVWGTLKELAAAASLSQELIDEIVLQLEALPDREKQ
jgi:hypothetical protein